MLWIHYFIKERDVIAITSRRVFTESPYNCFKTGIEKNLLE